MLICFNESTKQNKTKKEKKSCAPSSLAFRVPYFSEEEKKETPIKTGAVLSEARHEIIITTRKNEAHFTLYGRQLRNGDKNVKQKKKNWSEYDKNKNKQRRI